MPYPINQADTAQPETRSQKKAMCIAHASGCGASGMSAIGWRWLVVGAYLTLCFFASNSIALLNSAKKLIALSFDGLTIVVGQRAPPLLDLAGELLPVSRHLGGVWSDDPARGAAALISSASAG
jgi:hypothetical protein